MIIRKNKTGNYSQVDNALWTDKRISVTARFILGFMLSLPDDWRFNIGWMAKQIGMNRDTVGKYVQELIDNGFIMRERVRHDDGTFGDYEYTVYEDHAESTCAGSTYAEDVRTTKSKEINTYNKHVVVERDKYSAWEDSQPEKTEADIVPKWAQCSIVQYPSDIISALSRHNLTVNAATLKRWLSLASEDIIVQVIEYAVGRNIRSVIGYITAILMQGWMAPSTSDHNCSVAKRPKRRNGHSVKRDILPDYVQRQIERQQQEEVPTTSKLSEEQRLQAEYLLRALGEI